MSARTTMMESSSNKLVYLHKNPRPIRTPVRGQCQENFGLFSTTHQDENMAATHKKSESGSIVIRKAPRLKIGVAVNPSTAPSAADALNIRRPKSNKSRLVPAPSNGLKKRTPNSFGPKIIVLARMAKATPGPLLKYAGASRSDHIQ